MLKRRITAAVIGGFFLCLLALGVAGLVLRNRVGVALAATEQLREPLAARDVEGACLQVRASARAWNQAAVISAPLGPVLRRLGWVPRVGPELRLSPDLIELARGGTNAGTIVCDLVAPVGEAAGPIQIEQVARQLGSDPRVLAAMLREVERCLLYTSPSPRDS